MSTTKYTPRHKRPESYGGSTGRGPERWARAYAFALTHPKSKHAQLLYDRIRVAVDIANELEDVRFAHLQRDVDPRNPHPLVPKYKVTSVTCGPHCAAMQVQLDHATSGDFTATLNIFNGNYVTCEWGTEIEVPHYRFVRELRHGDTRRDRRCSVCASTVKKK